MKLAVLLAVVAALWLVGSAKASLHRSLWLCVHEHERTAWNDSGAPYWGGLQMGAWFVSTYATPTIRKRLRLHGHPGQWTPLQQMQLAEHAYTLSGFSRRWLAGQWPPSRGRCF